ncbi:MAG: hypothetical protein PF441_11965 [Desulfuromusa sp.]|jgi:hypothetical protein|nr:hypothetical protein [Desulfuromusa sp.]
MMVKLVSSVVLGILLTVNSSITDAANISFQIDQFSAVISIDGEIQAGDYLKFRSTVTNAFVESTVNYEWFIKNLKENNPKRYNELHEKTGDIGGVISLTVSLNSGGGSLEEAIKIGQSTRKMALKTSVADTDGAVCSSACFFVWVAGIKRSVPARDDPKCLGIHRVYFKPDHYKGLSSRRAEQVYSEAQNTAVAYLLEMGVPIDIANKSFRIPSNEVYFLNQNEVSDLEGIVPYFEELLIARCGSYSKQEEKDYLDCQIIYPQLSQERYAQFGLQFKKSISSKCNALSSGYRSYLENTYMENRRCRNLNSDIESWKRIATYLGFSQP